MLSWSQKKDRQVSSFSRNNTVYSLVRRYSAVVCGPQQCAWSYVTAGKWEPLQHSLVGHGRHHSKNGISSEEKQQIVTKYLGI